jgi:hypothetical protein
MFRWREGVFETSIKSIQCLDCREIIGYFDNFGIPAQVIIGGYCCKKCRPKHRPLTSQSIAIDAVQELTSNVSIAMALNRKSRATDW